MKNKKNVSNEKEITKVETINKNEDTVSSVPETIIGDNTEVYDDGEIASAAELMFLNQALEKQKEKMAPEKHPDFDGVHCLDCEVEIIKKRLEMGKIRCTECQTILEDLEKRKNRK